MEREARRIPLPWLLTPVVIANVVALVADIAGPNLIVTHPLLQIALQPRNRYLLLGSPNIDTIPFYVVGFVRLVLTDPIAFILGWQYGDAAIAWAERRMGDSGVIRTIERWFGRVAPVVILIAPSMYWCILAGASRMKPRLFIALNVTGTIGRLVLFRLAGDAFRVQLEDVLDWIQRYQVWLIAASAVLVVIQLIGKDRGTAVVTGASSGIGAATAHRLAAEGFDVVVGARRVDRLREVAEPIGARAIALDVTDAASVAAFCAEVPDCRVLVNNAGGALGLEPIAEADDDQWRTMYDTNVLGTMRMTRELLPKLEASGDGHVVMIGSVAGWEPYVGGAGYNAAKFGLRAMTDVLREELLGKPIRVSSVDPGMVETEFSVVRFAGGEQQAAAVYDRTTPLTADDVADCIAFVVTRPSHVNIDTLLVLPRDQAGPGRVYRHD